MQYGLSRIILIDSYLPGRLYEIDINGHTNIMGENDMGKTTLIKLAVLFYGESPVKLGIKRNDALKHKGFAEHYLPRSSSYVIFEYLTAGEPRMVVMSSLQDTKDQFRRTFVKSAFNREDFWLDDSDTPLRAEQWLKEAPLKYKVEHCQSGDAQTRKLLEGRDSHFSMVPSRLNLTRMKSLMTSMFSRNAGHTELTKIIEEWARSDLGSDFSRNLETISVPKVELEEWAANYHSYRSLDRAKDRFVLLDNLIREYDSTSERAKGLFSLAKRRREAIFNQKEDEQSQYKINRGRLQEALNVEQGLLLQLQREYKIYKSSHQKLLNEQQVLDSTFKVLQENIPSNFSELKAANENTLDRIQQIEAEIKKITSGQQKANEWKDKQLDDAHQLYNSKLQSIDAAIQSAKSDKYQSIHEHHKQLELHLESRLREIEAEKSAITKQVKSAVEELSVLKGRLISPSLTEQELETQKQLKDQVTELERSKELASIERDNANKAKQDVKRKYETEYAQFAVITEELKNKEEELEELHEILHAQDGSFLSFLKCEVPDWQDTHGRTLKPEVLRAKGLSPQLSNHGLNNCIFGVEIEVGALPEHYLALGDDNKLRDQIIELEKEVDVLSQVHEKLNKLCIKLSKQFDDADRQVILTQSEYEKKYKLYNRFRDDLAAEESHLQHLFTEHKKCLKNQYEEADEGHQHLSSQLDALNHDIKLLKSEASDKKTNFERSAEISYKNSISSLEQNKKEAEKQRKDRATQINNQYQHMLSENGIDGGYITALNTERDGLKELDARCKRIVAAHDAFMQFKSEEYDNRYPNLVNELLKALELKEAKLDSVRSKEKSRNKIEGELNTLYQKNELSKNTLNRAITRIEELVLEYGMFDSLTPSILYETYSVEQICEHFKEHRSQLRTSKEQIRSFNIELSSLFRTPGTGAFNYLSSDPGNPDDPIQVAKRINRYIQGGFYQVDYTSFIQSTQKLERISLYVDYLRQFKGKIQRYNRGLNDHMERAVAFNGIDRLEVDITFQYSDRNDWMLVSDIAKNYRHWKSGKNVGRLDSSQVELPHIGLVEAIEQYLNTPNAENMSINELYKHIDFTIKITENGEEKVARSFLEILSSKGGASSNGTSYLILITIFIGILNMMRKGREVHFTWALDELADISPNNITQLLKLLEDNHINLVSACTVASESVYLSFCKTYTIEYDPETGDKILADEEVSDPLAALLSDMSNDSKEAEHA
jgi:hypothetical protein